jgi:hypothetical protein
MALSLIKTNSIAADAITAAKIAPNTVVAADIAADAITASELANDAVDTAAVADEAITNVKLSHMAANTVKVRDAATAGDPSDKAVADTQILIGDGTGFTAASLSGDVTMANTGAVTIANSAVEDAMVATGIDAAKLADGTVSNTELQYINSLTSNAQTQISATVTVANAALPKAGGTMSGETIFADQLVTRPEIKDYSETYNASSGTGTVDLDLETGNVFQHTASGGNVTFTFSNPPATGKAGSFTLKWIQDSSDRTITWPGSVDWAGGSAPDVTSGSAKVDMYVFTTFDAGTTWYGFQSGADLS